MATPDLRLPQACDYPSCIGQVSQPTEPSLPHLSSRKANAVATLLEGPAEETSTESSLRLFLNRPDPLPAVHSPSTSHSGCGRPTQLKPEWECPLSWQDLIGDACQ